MLFTSAQVLATVSLNDYMVLTCISTDQLVIASCRLDSTAVTTDDAMFVADLNDEYTLTAGEQTNIDVILGKAKANTKTVHSID